MAGVELIYEYMHQHGLATRSDFAARFDGPVLLFRRVVTSKELGESTLTAWDAKAAKRVNEVLSAKQLQLRREAYEHRLVRLPADGVVTIGRTIHNNIPLPNRMVSKQHAKIACDSGQVFITDLDSKNGTFIDEQRLPPHDVQPFSAGQQLRIGSVTLRLLTGLELYDALAELTENRVTP